MFFFFLPHPFFFVKPTSGRTSHKLAVVITRGQTAHNKANTEALGSGAAALRSPPPSHSNCIYGLVVHQLLISEPNGLQMDPGRGEGWWGVGGSSAGRIAKSLDRIWVFQFDVFCSPTQGCRRRNTAVIEMAFKSHAVAFMQEGGRQRAAFLSFLFL